MKEYKIIDVDGDSVLTIETDSDVSQYSDNQINVGSIKLRFENEVALEVELPDDYSDEFIIDIDDGIYDAVIESLTDRGVDYETASDIADSCRNISINVQVDISAEDGDAEVTDVCTY